VPQARIVMKVRHDEKTGRPDNRVTDLDFDPDNSHLTTTDGYTTRIWEFPGGREVVNYREDAWVKGLQFGNNGRYLLVASEHEIQRRIWRQDDLIEDACSIRPELSMAALPPRADVYKTCRCGRVGVVFNL
jgi:WD40 repeat protein